jgi:hypothetical protein
MQKYLEECMSPKLLPWHHVLRPVLHGLGAVIFHLVAPDHTNTGCSAAEPNKQSVRQSVTNLPPSGDTTPRWSPWSPWLTGDWLLHSSLPLYSAEPTLWAPSVLE